MAIDSAQDHKTSHDDEEDRVDNLVTDCEESATSNDNDVISNEINDTVNSLLRNRVGAELESELKGSISWEQADLIWAGNDFGNIYHDVPAAVIRPATASDVAAVVRYAAANPGLTVGARGNGHSTYGQAQALGGLVMDMGSLNAGQTHVAIMEDGRAYVDAPGGAKWIEVLEVCLEQGLAPRSWPDYLHLTVGGTIQSAGIGGQSFRYGPVISNVVELEVVTGNGELKTCSRSHNQELFFAILGSLGQFAIVTKARIILAKAPNKVRWIRMLYADVDAFTRDQERLIRGDDVSDDVGSVVDYVEGFVICNNADPVNGLAQVAFTPGEPVHVDTSLIPLDSGPVLYCLEVIIHYDNSKINYLQDKAKHNDDVHLDEKHMNEVASMLQNSLGYVKGLSFSKDVSYVDFLNRVYAQELELQKLGMWRSSHPWLCLFIPASVIKVANDVIFKKNLTKGVNGPILMYPMLKKRWDDCASVIIPNEEIFYTISLLWSDYPPPIGPLIDSQISQNNEILQSLESFNIPHNLYIPKLKSTEECKKHFGPFWQKFSSLKQRNDPLGILSPGQSIFLRGKTTTNL